MKCTSFLSHLIQNVKSFNLVSIKATDEHKLLHIKKSFFSFTPSKFRYHRLYWHRLIFFSKNFPHHSIWEKKSKLYFYGIKFNASLFRQRRKRENKKTKTTKFSVCKSFFHAWLAFKLKWIKFQKCLLLFHRVLFNLCQWKSFNDTHLFPSCTYRDSFTCNVYILSVAKVPKGVCFVVIMELNVISLVKILNSASHATIL